MASDRRHARILAMQALCQWDVQGDQSREALDDFLSAYRGAEGSATYAAKLVESFWARREDVDGHLESAVAKWDLSRISPVERNVMRVAVAEMLSGRIPPKVALSEAIELGREYAGADSSRFINGVLDNILKRLPSTAGESADGTV